VVSSSFSSPETGKRKRRSGCWSPALLPHAAHAPQASSRGVAASGAALAAAPGARRPAARLCGGAAAGSGAAERSGEALSPPAPRSHIIARAKARAAVHLPTPAARRRRWRTVTQRVHRGSARAAWRRRAIAWAARRTVRRPLEIDRERGAADRERGVLGAVEREGRSLIYGAAAAVGQDVRGDRAR